MKEKSFTIVELLVVMAVIGVLLSLSVFGIRAIQKSQRETQRLTDLRNIQSLLESYFSHFKRYPVGIIDIGYGSDNTNEIKISDSGSSISLYNKVTNSTDQIQYGSTLTLQSPGVTVTSSVVYADPCPENDVSADKWYIAYISDTVSPQQYGLWGCTENGATPLTGTLNDGSSYVHISPPL